MKRHNTVGKRFIIALAIMIGGVGSVVYAQKAQEQKHTMPQTDKPAAPCPMMQPEQPVQADTSAKDGHAGHAAQLAAVNARGERAMGFSQTKTTHHFFLRPDGGVIQVEVNEPTDTASRAQIRQHLTHITEMFAAGDFQTPMLVHEQVPPGVVEMKRLRTAIKFAYEETEQGGRVLITTDDAQALAAVHEFLRFQVKDHQTGDSLDVNK